MDELIYRLTWLLFPFLLVLTVADRASLSLPFVHPIWFVLLFEIFKEGPKIKSADNEMYSRTNMERIV
jgi:hypothetical protein